jgi:hypothetical protein
VDAVIMSKQHDRIICLVGVFKRVFFKGDYSLP